MQYVPVPIRKLPRVIIGTALGHDNRRATPLPHATWLVQYVKTSGCTVGSRFMGSAVKLAEAGNVTASRAIASASGSVRIEDVGLFGDIRIGNW